MGGWQKESVYISLITELKIIDVEMLSGTVVLCVLYISDKKLVNRFQ